MTDPQNPESAAEYISKRPWRPSVEPDTYPSLEEIVGQAVGAGSVCWTSTPNGIFKSEQAKWIVDGAVESIRRTLKLDEPVAHFPYVSNLGGHIIIGPECFADPEETTIMWKGREYKATPDQPETLAALINQALGGIHDLAEVVTRAYNAGYEGHTADVQGQPTFCNRCDIKVDQEGFNEWADKVGPTPADPEIGMAEEPEEAKQWRIQRDADKASVIDLILHYKNPADDEKRMRQIRVVMD